jgi:peptide deformylase
MILKIRQVGEPALRQFARPLSRDEILSPHIQELIVAMRETMRDAPGVGLAAPQVGFPLQIAVIEDKQDYIDKLAAGQAAERNRSAVPFQVIINPGIIAEEEEEEQVPFFEGCLSLAGFTAIVPRAAKVRVECLNENAEPVEIRAEGWYARILQHEIDHLHGKLYIDRMYSRTFMTLDNFGRHGKDVATTPPGPSQTG